MKIIYISSSYIPSRSANSIHVMKMSQAFAQHGHDVLLLVQQQEDNIEVQDQYIYEYYGVEKVFNLIKLRRWKNIFGGLIYAFRCIIIVKCLKPDLVYTRNLLSLFICVILRLAVVFEAHKPINKPIKKHLFKYAIKQDSFLGLVVITEALKKYYSNRYPCIGNIIVAHDGADAVDESLAGINFNDSKDRLQVGYVGHLYAGKGMEVIGSLSSKCPWADFHVVGGTEDDIDRWRVKLAGVSNLKFHGFVVPNKVQYFIKGFDVVLLPNQEKVSVYGGGKEDIGQWTSPLKAFEYMAAGKTIICSDLPVLREIFIHEHNALLCKPDDVQSWQNALMKIRDEPRSAKQIGRNAKIFFENGYSWKKRAEKILNSIILNY